MNVMKYGIVIERGKRNCSVYVPDLPGCVATGKTVAEAKERIQKAIHIHLEGMLEDGDPIPEPRTICDVVEVAQGSRISEPHPHAFRHELALCP